MSFITELRKLPKTKTDPFILGLTRHELHLFYTDFVFRAHDYQIEPKGDHNTWLLMGGRGSGKTRAGSEAVIHAARYENARHIALVGENLSDVLSVMVHGESGIMKCAPYDFKPIVKRSENYLLFPNGVRASFFSANDPDSLRGPQFHYAWCDELAKWRYAEETWDNLQMGLRLGENPRQIVTTTPRPRRIIEQIRDDPDTVMTHATTYQNAANLAPKFIDSIMKKYEKTRYGRQEIFGELLSGLDGALWTREQLDQVRIPIGHGPNHFDRIVVGVDPPVTGGENADECGIIVAGVKKDPDKKNEPAKIYILADYSVAGLSPNGWAEQVARAYHDYGASRIIAESNQGGDMVRSIIHNIDPDISFKAAWARRGKIARAEPVAALYEQERIHHIGQFNLLEDQMCMFTLDHIYTERSKSPDRVDALVWAVTDIIYNQNYNNPQFHTI